MRVLGIPVLSCVALVVAFVYLVYLYLVMILYMADIDVLAGLTSRLNGQS